MTSVIESGRDYFKLNPELALKKQSEQKFGMFVGVFVPCLLMLFGVIIFLRLGWIVGQVGLLTSTIIITISSLTAFISTLSMASISTNIQIGKGGVYYIISRSLGIEIGSAVGLPLYLKQALSIAFCCVGFAESLHDLMPSWSILNIGVCTLLALTFLAYTSVKGALKIQVAIFVLLVFSFISLFTGGELQPRHAETFAPATSNLGFWAVFAIFFPAMTGVESIVSLSGNLKNPSRSIPIGTIAASIVSFIMYMTIAVFLAWHVPIERLANDPLILQDIASIPSLIILGIWGATLSSALGGLLSAPRTLQAISDDGILPKIFGKTYGVSKEPRIATLVTCFIAFIAIFYGSINVIAPVMTMICLVSYGVLNFSSGFETLMSNPSWRPLFRVHWVISVVGALLCLLIMLMIDAGTAILSLLGVFCIYLAVKRKKFQGSWEDIRQGILMFISRYAIYGLAYGPSCSKSWRPHFLVFTKSSEKYSHNLLSFAEAISQSKSFLTMASFVSEKKINPDRKKQLGEMIAKRLKNKNIQAFVNLSEGENIYFEMRQMLKYYGIGPLKANTVIFGGINNGAEAEDFTKTIKYAFDCRYNVIVVNDEIISPSELSHVEGNHDIHIWWDDEDENSSELMLILAHMMQGNPDRKKCRICLKTIVKDERAREGKLNSFKNLSTKLRLSLDVDVYVSDQKDNILFHFIKRFSAQAGIILLPLKYPKTDVDSSESYNNYLDKLSKITDESPNIALVLSSEHTPLDSILL